MAVELSRGLEFSLKVLNKLKRDKELKEIPILVGTFTNCREVGLTFIVDRNENNLSKTFTFCVPSKIFTFCVYEHRNSDRIIINGKQGFIVNCGELPYYGDKWTYFAGFPSTKEGIKDCASALKEMIIAFYKKGEFYAPALKKMIRGGKDEG